MLPLFKRGIEGDFSIGGNYFNLPIPLFGKEGYAPCRQSFLNFFYLKRVCGEGWDAEAKAFSVLAGCGFLLAAEMTVVRVFCCADI